MSDAMTEISQPEFQESTLAGEQGLISLTANAVTQLSRILEDPRFTGIRLGVTGGGCAGLQYLMEPAENAIEGDLIQNILGIPFFIHPMAAPYLKDVQIDYSNALMDGGFKFSNPNASSTCGCGTSFGI